MAEKLSKKNKKNKPPSEEVDNVASDTDVPVFKKHPIRRRLILGRQRKDIQQKLKDVYTDSSGKIPDLSRLEKSPRSTWKVVLYTMIIILFILLMTAIAGFFFFNNLDGDSFTNEKITLKIDTPITISSGQEMTYTVMITNSEKVSLYNAELELEYPENFEHISSEPLATGEDNNIWKFSILRVGETQKIELTGKLLAAINSTQTFKGVLKFKPANLNAEFKQEAIVDVMVASSVINLDIDGPNKTLANQEVEYTITYKNVGEDDLVNLQVVANYPEGFVLISTNPEARDGSDNLWDLETLEVEGEGKIKIKGDYSALNSGGNQDFKVRIQIDNNGDYYPQSEKSFITNVVKDQLSLRLIINGSEEDQPINFDDLLVYSLDYKNTGELDLEDITIVAHLDSQMLDWGSLRDSQNGSWKNGTITWTGKEIPNLLKLGPEEEGEITWTIRVKDANILASEDISKFNVESYANAEAKQEGEVSGTSIVESKTIINSINSDLSLNARAQYYNDFNIPLGSGPIQPKVGEKSSYNINLSLANNLHDIKDLVLVASLPSNATWDNKENHSVGDVIYNEGANKVTWNIARLAKSATNNELSFNVEIEPTDDDFGRVLLLVSNIRLTATDADTGSNIEVTKKAITTSFDDPILGQVSGIVE